MVAGTAQLNAGNPKLAQFEPVSGALAVSAWYNVFLTSLIKDINNNAMPVSGKFTFLTAGAPPPSAPVIASSQPASGSVGVSVSSNLTVTMDKILLWRCWYNAHSDVHPMQWCSVCRCHDIRYRRK